MPTTRQTINAAAAAALLTAIITLPVASSAAAPGSDAVLRLAVLADDHVSYTGTITTLIYVPGGADATVVRIDHAAPDKWRMWYVAPADAYGRLIVSNESTTYQYEPKIATVFSDAWSQSSPGVALEIDAGKVLKNYTVTQGPDAQVAGRNAVTLSLSSKYSGALVQRIWVDKTTNLVLQRETYHSDGTIDQKTGFEDVRIVNDLPKELFDLTVPAGMHLEQGATYGKAAKDVATIQATLDFTVVSPTYLPEGFDLEKASQSVNSGVHNVQLIYTDGLRDFSVFENSTKRLPDLENAKQIDVGDATGETVMLDGETVLSWNTGGMNVTMVGDLTARELAKIGASVRP
jgi:outer membrane lipoprotein-sorting protein